MGQLGKATCTVSSISAQTSQKRIECTKVKEQLRAYCSNTYTVNVGIKNELPLEIAMKYKNFEIVKEITPYVAIKGDDYYLRDYP